MRVLSCLAGSAAALALVTSSATASTYCAGTTGGDCATVHPATGAGLQAALDDADTNIDIGGTPDTVRIGPGTFTTLTGFRTLGGDVSIVGAGQATVLTSPGGPVSDVPIFGPKAGGAPATSLSQVQIQVAGFQAGGISGVRQVSDVRIGGPGTLYGDAIRLPDGGRVTRVVVDPAGLDDTPAIEAMGGVIEDTLIRVRAAGGAEIPGVRVRGSGSPGTSVLSLRHVSILGDGAPATQGLVVQPAFLETGVAVVTVHLRDSLVHGVHAALVRRGDPAYTGPGCAPKCLDAVANIDSRFSSFAAGTVLSSGPGALSAGPGDLPDLEPLLAADGSPQTGSPLIGAGDPDGPEAGDSPTDVAGNSRIKAGRRDIGAFESALAPEPAPAPTAPQPAASPRPPTDPPPLISDLRLSPRRFRVGAAPKRGTTVRFTLSETARYDLQVDRVLRGRTITKPGKPTVCRAATTGPTTPNGRPCLTYRSSGSRTGTSAGGPVVIAFSGRLHGKPLPPGSYRLTVAARDSTGGIAQDRSITFTVAP